MSTTAHIFHHIDASISVLEPIIPGTMTPPQIRGDMRNHDEHSDKFQCPHSECESRRRQMRKTFSRKDLLWRHLRIFHATKDGERNLEDDVKD